MTNERTLPPMQRLPYDLRLRIGKALDRLVCDDSTPEQVDKFVATFAHFDLTITSTPKDIDGGRFAEWSLADIIGQCRMQSREQLDPEFAQFMAELAERFSSLAAPAPSDPLMLAIAAVLDADKDFREQMPAGWDGDPLTDAIDGLRATLAAPSPAQREVGL